MRRGLAFFICTGLEEGLRSKAMKCRLLYSQEDILVNYPDF